MPDDPGGLVVITLLIVDDHPVVRDGLTALIDTVDNVVVVAQADTAEGAIRAAQTHRPDVVLMDLNLPGASGIYATRRITQTLPGTAVLVLTMSEDDESILAAIRAGARGYLLKGARQQEILTAIETVASGGALFSPPRSPAPPRAALRSARKPRPCSALPGTHRTGTPGSGADGQRPAQPRHRSASRDQPEDRG
jgi:DNA-binding NarL/FixJ family response regulator